MNMNSLRRAAAMAVVAAAVMAAAPEPHGQGGGAGLVARVDVLIAFPSTPGPVDEALVRAAGGVITYTYHLVPAIAARMPAWAVSTLRSNARVAAIEPDGPVFALAQEAELDNTWGVRRIGAGTVHQTGDLGTGVTVAVLDSGIDYTHPELGVSFGGGWDFVNNDPDPWDDYGHGTHVAGTIAAALDDAGVVGGAPGVRLYALKVLNAQGTGSWSRVIAALQWAVDNHIQITNNSYAGGTPANASTVRAAFDNAEAAGVLHVAAAGNSGWCAGTNSTILWPAAVRSVIAVGAVDVNDTRPCFSSTGPKLELMAPGVGINSTFPDGGYGVLSGTSSAAPHVAAASALVMAAGVTDWNDNGRVNDEVRAILAATAFDLGSPGFDTQYGFGLVDAAAAVAALKPTPPTITSFTPAESPAGRGTSVTISGTDFADATAVAFNGTGASFLATSATTIDAMVPGDATTGPISVTTPGGTATSSGMFTITDDTAPVEPAEP